MNRFLRRSSQFNPLKQRVFLRYNIRQFSGVEEQLVFKETCATYRELWPGEEPTFKTEELAQCKKNTWMLHESGQPCIIRSILPMKSHCTYRVAMPFVEAYQGYSNIHVQKLVQTFQADEDSFSRYLVLSYSEDEKNLYFKYLGDDGKVYPLKCAKSRGTPMGRYNKVMRELDETQEMLCTLVQEAPYKVSEDNFQIVQFVQGFAKEKMSKDAEFEYIYHDEDDETVTVNCFNNDGEQIEISISKEQQNGVLWKVIQEEIEKYDAGEGNLFITCWDRLKDSGDTQRVICGARIKNFELD